MAGLLLGDASQQGAHQVGSQRYSEEKPEDGSRWYFSRKEIEENSPSQGDGIDLKKETYLRKSYCTFLQDLGMRLKVPQVTIATAIIFCHRFFLRQSHAKNDRRTVATVCMFLAGKVEETPRPLKDVILVSYEIINKKDPTAVQRIKQKEVYEQQKELILLAERVVLATLGFDFNVHHPYKPLVEAIKKFKVAQNALAQVAWNFVNDGLRTSLCLQFKPHHIAAGAIFLAAKFLKVKLPSDGEKVWWQEFDVTPRQLEEVSNQMLELYEQNRIPPSNEAEGTPGGATSNRTSVKAPSNDETVAANSNSQTGGTSLRPETSKPSSSKTMFDSSGANQVGRPVSNPGRSSDYGAVEMKHRVEDDVKINQQPEQELTYKENIHQAQDTVRSRSDNGEKELENNFPRTETKDHAEFRDKHNSRNSDHRDSILNRPPQEAIKKIDRDKVKAALEKRRKAAGHITKKTDIMDDDDLIEKELEDGIELPPPSEKSKQDRRQNWSKLSADRSDYENTHARHQDHADEQPHGVRSFPSRELDPTAVEEGEVSAFDDVSAGLSSPKSSHRKRKAGSSPDRVAEGKQRHNYGPGSHHNNRSDYVEDRSKASRLSHTERDSKRHAQENHV
ncbi:cyclin-T1-5-like isoform X1 [Vicia villosa]|uniref:cyclin-T1-5-like isoform X1 n=1 Tax=Vicia villosa TaxID=3911 RepID=UPI00273BE7F9|nr:cyclin-T1-5-like isoform X1 [Vicia villosa]